MWVLRKWHILRNWQIWQGFIKGLAKILNETTKEAYWQLAIFAKMARIHQRFCKTSNEVTKRAILTNGGYKKMANFGRKREISAKMTSIPKSHQGFSQIFNRPIRLTQCCTQFKSPGDKILCVLYLHYNVAFTFKWYGNYWNKTFYSQRVWIGYNIELAE